MHINCWEKSLKSREKTSLPKKSQDFNLFPKVCLKNFQSILLKKKHKSCILAKSSKNTILG